MITVRTFPSAFTKEGGRKKSWLYRWNHSTIGHLSLENALRTKIKLLANENMGISAPAGVVISKEI